MSDIFISYARATATEARAVAAALRALGYGVWLDDALPAHRPYADVIEERLRDARAVVVVWSAEAARSQWVRSEADRARSEGKLVQLRVDAAPLPMPFDQIQCADLAGWSGDPDAPGWRQVAASVADLLGGPAPIASPAPSPVSSAAPPLPDKPSIAVMPLANLSNDPEQEYFVDGMMDEIVTALTRNRALFVIASSSTLAFRARPASAQDVGRQLGVRYVLEGSVRKSGDRVRIAARLVDAADGAQIWAERFDDTLADVFALQDRVALSVAGVIGPKIAAADERRGAERPTESLGAYDLYLRATPLLRAFRKAEVTRALELLERAIELDPRYALAMASAATCHHNIAVYRWSDDIERHRDAGNQLAQRALSYGADDGSVLGQTAAALSYENLENSVELARRATTTNPGAAGAWFMSGMLHVRLGELEAGLDDLATAERLNPVQRLSLVQSWIAIARFLQGRADEAFALVWESTYQHPVGQIITAAICGRLGRLVEAREALERYRAATPRPIEEAVVALFARPEHRALILDGLAAARPPTEPARAADPS
ncbi:MAG TPA: TIR domain-containing protein [Caulobacteraceae bacterium]|nr:TIR domain-containing protein [Caulobacteraceae bacterium]